MTISGRGRLLITPCENFLKGLEVFFAAPEQTGAGPASGRGGGVGTTFGDCGGLRSSEVEPWVSLVLRRVDCRLSPLLPGSN